jgi:hypothetical protein
MKKTHLGIFLIGFGILVLALFFIALKNCKATAAWPSTSGKILSSEIREDADKESTRASIQYEYTVNGQPYTSKTIRAFGVGKFNAAEPASRVKDYPAGKELTVYYNPENHSRSVLLHGLPDNWYFFILGTCVLFLLGVFVIMNEFVNKKDNTEQKSEN